MHRKIARILITGILLLASGLSYAQNNNAYPVDLLWAEYAAQPVGFSFNGAQWKNYNGHNLPVYFKQIKTEGASQKATIRASRTSSIYIQDKEIRDQFSDDFKVESYYTWVKGEPYLNIIVLPFRLNGETERLEAFEIVLGKTEPQEIPGQNQLKKKADFESESVLSSGEWLKIRTNQEGIFEITRTLLEQGGWNVSNIDLRTIKVYGNGGGLLPEPIDQDRIDDIGEVKVKVVDHNGDNIMDQNDRIYFYGQGAGIWKYNAAAKRFVHENHHYSNSNYYYITYGGSASKRVGELPDGKGLPFDKTITSYDVMVLHEDDDENFIESGREWYGNPFKNNTTQNFSHTISNIVSSEPSSIRYRGAARSTVQSFMTVYINGVQVSSDVYGRVSGDYEHDYATDKTVIKSFTPTSENVALEFQYTPTSPEANAWIDYYELAVRRELTFTGGQGQYMVYSKDIDQIVSGRYQFTGSNFEIWDVTDHQDVAIQKNYDITGGKKEFIVMSPFLNKAKRYCAWDGSSAYTPVLVGNVANQNLHGLAPVNYLMVVHPDFMEQANRLADFHRSYYQSSVTVVNLNDIYNEFSSGKPDAVAIRDFIRMFYVRSNDQGVNFENVLLFGDGSYDFKDRIKNNTNYIPTFQSRESISPTGSYGADDFFAILDPNEGYFDVGERPEGLDVGIGRIPCRTNSQARIYVDKVIRYHSRETYGSWRNNVTLLADDEDGNKHMKDSDTMDKILSTEAPVLNINKIYLDAFNQVSYGSGDKYPDVNDAIDKAFEKGHLIFNYLGHGGGSGMAHERVVTRTMITEWDNKYAMPLVITATCELSRYDDPSQDSPGELMAFNENGGAIGLITTTRIIWINLNADLNVTVLRNNLFQRDLNGEYPKLGQVFSTATNNSQQAINQRNFTLLGDPGIRLAYPKYNIVTTKVNDSLITGTIDTIKAFTKMKIEGEIRDLNNNVVTGFNGTVDPTVFDKTIEYRTLQNDPKVSEYKFTMQNSAIYRGKVSVTNGKFFFEFVVPKDIDYRFGSGKIVYYAESAQDDANGVNKDITVGGSATDQITDTVPPNINVFMDDTEFIFGGLTGESSILLVLVSDSNGINTVGNGIGRDIMATLDEGTDNEEFYVLNDFYQARLNSYQEGEIRYQLSNLTEGRHTVRVKVWDVFNNSNEAYTEFVVAEDADIALDHVLNYPNPFTTFTTFHFDHNKSGRQLDVTIKIMTPSGRVIKTLYNSDIAAGGHFQSINWDGKDEFGDTIGRGVYVYKVIVKSEDGTAATEYQKLVILK